MLSLMTSLYPHICAPETRWRAFWHFRSRWTFEFHLSRMCFMRLGVGVCSYRLMAECTKSPPVAMAVRPSVRHCSSAGIGSGGGGGGGNRTKSAPNAERTGISRTVVRVFAPWRLVSELYGRSSISPLRPSCQGIMSLIETLLDAAATCSILLDVFYHCLQFHSLQQAACICDWTILFQRLHNSP